MKRRPILVIEDDEPIRESLKEFLEYEGFQVLLAANGKAGLEILQTTQLRSPCLILLDMQMPVMSGEVFLKALRDDSVLAGRDHRVIVLTARAELPTFDVTACLKKPIDLDDLLLELKRHS